MKKLKFFAATVCAGLAAMASAQADESPRWLRNTSISPDGSKIAFTYRGDIFTIPTAGGEAHQLTSGGSYNTSPIWSPDSRTIVFSSDREGSYDLYRVASTGGTPIRLTTYSGNETPLAFLSPDKVIYSTSEITSEKSIRNPVRHTRTYAIDINTPDARPELYLSMPLGSASIAPDGKMLYHDRKGLEDPLRKHERSSGTCDVWLYDKGVFTKLTNFNGHDMNPVWKADGKGYYYLSEESGTINVYAADGKGGKRQLTNFEKHPVRSLSVSGSGLMAFSQDGDIYTLREGETPSKVNVSIYADQYKKDIIKGFAGSGASGISISPEGKEVAIVVRGEVYVTDTKYSTTKRITNTAAQEREISFSPDGRKLVYDSERDGIWQLFISEIKNPSEKRFAYATEIEEKPLYKSELPAQQPRFSPDGKKVAFLENRTTLRVIDVESKKVTTILDGKYNYSYSDGDVPFEWSPDSQWILISYIGIGGWNNTDVAAVKADGSRVVDLTESGYSDGNAKWVLGGKAIAYETGKYGMKSHGSWGNQSDIVLMALDADAWDQINAT
ncbi:MAG: peptidase S41, partial [Muribaculaceae bacterium]|nr:peptidase S41 [Bacteroidales bacterium]MDY2733268.1 peptidase S41 [Muribaculaceae bacterium]